MFLAWWSAQILFSSWSELARAIPCARDRLRDISSGKSNPNYRIRIRLHEITGLSCFMGPANRREASNKRRRESRSYLTEANAIEACTDDPRKIREIAGPDSIVCPGTKKQWCGLVAKSLNGAHLEIHFPGHPRPGIALRDEWQLPAGFPLASAKFVMAEAQRGKAKGVRIAREAEIARLAA